jgi:hypothetical protein
MYDLLILVGISLIAASFMLRIQRKQSSRPSAAQETRRDAKHITLEVAAADDKPQAVPRDGRFSFVSAFGVRPANLRELHVYTCVGKLDEFPQKVGELLRKLYNNGSAVGEEMMALVNHGRVLNEGEAIYVAVERDERTNRSRTIAFLDRHRTC